MKTIKLSQNKVAIVDDEDYEYLNKLNWSAIKSGNNTFYACRTEWLNGKFKMTQMHRVILKSPKNLMVDHINGNGLDNRRSNIRSCTNSQNQFNRGSQVNTSSKYLGVSLRLKDNRWVSQITVNGKGKYLGQFKTELEAAIIWNIACRKYRKDFGRPNKLTPNNNKN